MLCARVHSVLDEPPARASPTARYATSTASRRYGFVGIIFEGGMTLSRPTSRNFGAEPVANLLHDLPERDGLLHGHVARAHAALPLRLPGVHARARAPSLQATAGAA